MLNGNLSISHKKTILTMSNRIATQKYENTLILQSNGTLYNLNFTIIKKHLY